jgi:hypothetical protein
MRFHCEPFARDKVLTRMMEVELLECVPAVTYVERAAFCEVKLDRVAIVDHRVRPFSPTDLERGLPRTDSACDVDGRLLAACGAWGVRCVETTPFVGSRRPLVLQ